MTNILVYWHFSRMYVGDLRFDFNWGMVQHLILIDYNSHYLYHCTTKKAYMFRLLDYFAIH